MASLFCTAISSLAHMTQSHLRMRLSRACQTIVAFTRAPGPESRSKSGSKSSGLSLDSNPVCLRVNVTNLDQDLDQNPRVNGAYAIGRGQGPVAVPGKNLG